MRHPWLDEYPAFAALEPRARALLEDCAIKTIPCGSILFSPGAVCSGFVLILSGVARISLAGESGRSIVLYRVTAKDICIQTTLCALSGAAYGVEGKAETDLRLVFIPIKRFEALMELSKVFRNFVFDRLGQRLGDVTQQLEDVAFATLDMRLSRALLSRADATGYLRLTHQELAEEAISSREVVTRRLNLYAKEGALRIGRGHIELLERKLLEERAGPTFCNKLLQ